MRQEIVLGIGGVKALAALGIQPDVFHMNEGHSAFLALERIRLNVVEKKLEFLFGAASRRGGQCFHHTHAGSRGQRSFSREMMQKYFGKFAKRTKRSLRRAVLIRPHALNPDEPFSMTILALRLSRHANGVSKLHGEVSRSLWKDVWSGVPMHEVPITSITNGVHTKTWMAPEFAALYRQASRRLGRAPDEPDFCAASSTFLTRNLWETHQQLKRRLIDFVRDRERQRRERLGESPESIRRVNRILDPEILTDRFCAAIRDL